MKMKLNNKIIIGILAIILITAGAYATEYFYKNSGLKSGAVIKISDNNQLAAYFGSDVFKQLPGGSTEGSDEGPTLTSVLIAAGINSFASVEIKGVRDDSPYRLDGKQVGDDCRFYYTDHNTVNFALRSDRAKVLVEDVSEINVKD